MLANVSTAATPPVGFFRTHRGRAAAELTGAVALLLMVLSIMRSGAGATPTWLQLAGFSVMVIAVVRRLVAVLRAPATDGAPVLVEPEPAWRPPVS